MTPEEEIAFLKAEVERLTRELARANMSLDIWNRIHTSPEYNCVWVVSNEYDSTGGVVTTERCAICGSERTWIRPRR